MVGFLKPSKEIGSPCGGLTTAPCPVGLPEGATPVNVALLAGRRRATNRLDGKREVKNLRENEPVGRTDARAYSSETCHFRFSFPFAKLMSGKGAAS